VTSACSFITFQSVVSTAFPLNSSAKAYWPPSSPPPLPELLPLLDPDPLPPLVPPDELLPLVLPLPELLLPELLLPELLLPELLPPELLFPEPPPPEPLLPEPLLLEPLALVPLPPLVLPLLLLPPPLLLFPLPELAVPLLVASGPASGKPDAPPPVSPDPQSLAPDAISRATRTAAAADVRDEQESMRLSSVVYLGGPANTQHESPYPTLLEPISLKATFYTISAYTARSCSCNRLNLSLCSRSRDGCIFERAPRTGSGGRRLTFRACRTVIAGPR
jgi:hypothetical protein